MTRTYKTYHRIPMLTVLTAGLLLLSACTEDLYDSLLTQGDMLSLNLTVTEQGEGATAGMTAGTRGESLTGLTEENVPEITVRELTGEVEGLKVGGQELPFVGIHQRPDDYIAKTRAAANLSGWEESARNRVATTAKFHDDLTLFGYTSAGNIFTSNRGVKVEKESNWRTPATWPYGEAADLKLYAISPAIDNDGVEATITTPPDYTTPLSFRFTVAEKVSDQCDLLYGTGTKAISAYTKANDWGKDNKEVDLSFSHILTAVRFVQGTMPTTLKITKIALSGICDKRTFDGSDWTDDGATYNGSYEIDLGTGYTASEYSPGSNVYIDGGNVMFLMPHTLGSNAKLTLTLKDGEAEHTVSTSLTGDVWQKGYTFTYVISIGKIAGDYYFAADPGPYYFEHKDSETSGSIYIDSYRIYRDFTTSNAGVNAYLPVSVQVAGFSKTKDGEYKLNGDNGKTLKPSWLTSINGYSETEEVGSGSSSSGGKYEKKDFKIAPQTRVETLSHKTVLDPTTGNTTVSGTLDLSQYRGGATNAAVRRETANCYIVNRAGTYTFPLVYGNGIQNNNPIDLLGNDLFVDHRGLTIKNAWIATQIGQEDSNGIYYTFYDITNPSQIVGTAEVLWIDQNTDNSMTFSNVQLMTGADGGVYAQFTLGGTPQPGNALIVVKAKKRKKTSSGDEDLGNEIVWSWHIWVTDEVYGKDGTVNLTPLYSAYTDESDNTVDNWVMPVNLGWVPKDDSYGKFERREIWVQYKQVGTENTAKFCIRQYAKQEPIYGGTTIYQWGRPVALPMVATTETTESDNFSGSNPNRRHVMDGSDTNSYFLLTNLDIDSKQEAIRNPDKMVNRNTNCWWDKETDALWSTTKTLYDPCPPGFRVPETAVFSGVVTGSNYHFGTQRLGEYFYATPYPDDGRCRYNLTDKNEEWTLRDHPLIYMPCTGYWQTGSTGKNVLNIDGSSGNQIDFPSWGYTWTTEPKKAYGFQPLNYSIDTDDKAISCAMSIRPVWIGISEE